MSLVQVHPGPSSVTGSLRTIPESLPFAWTLCPMLIYFLDISIDTAVKHTGVRAAAFGEQPLAIEVVLSSLCLSMVLYACQQAYCLLGVHCMKV